MRAHLKEVYDAVVSQDTITRITQAVMAELEEWQNRPLDVYPVVFIDAIVVKIRDGHYFSNRRSRPKAACSDATGSTTSTSSATATNAS